MAYSEYKQKLQKTADRLYKIWRFRFLILAGVVLIAALVLALCFISGSIYGVSCPSSVEYGTPLGFEAKAVLASVSAEYYVSDEWTEEEPKSAGEYKVRAVSRGAFGVKYGEEYAYTVTPKNIELSFDGNRFEYGGDPEVSAALAYDDTVSEIAFDYTFLGDDLYEVTAEILAVADGGGRDVTENYVISPAVKQLTRVPRKITISTGSSSKTYDGSALCEQSYEITNGSLLEGQQISITYPEFTDAGTYYNQPEVTIYDGDGGDVSHNYSVTYDCGTIEILPRAITIATGSASKTYDGAEFYAKSYGLTEGSLVSGHEIDITYPGFVNAGTFSNTPEVIIRDGYGSDATGNYNINFESGDITILKRAITISTGSATKVYDGTALSCTDYELISGTLVSGHTLSPTAKSVSANSITEITDSDTEVGYHINSLEFTVSDGGNDVTANYDISYEYGNLRIKTPIIIYMYNYSKYYDGAALAYGGGFTVVKPPDVTVNCTLSTKSITEVGTVYSDEFTITGITVTDKSGGLNVNSENKWYIESGDCVLEVKPREIEVASVSAEKENTGITLTDDTAWISLGSLADGQTIVVTVTGELSPYETSAVNTISGVTIYDKSGNDVTANYSITLKEGTLSWL